LTGILKVHTFVEKKEMKIFTPTFTKERDKVYPYANKRIYRYEVADVTDPIDIGGVLVCASKENDDYLFLYEYKTGAKLYDFHESKVKIFSHDPISFALRVEAFMGSTEIRMNQDIFPIVNGEKSISVEDAIRLLSCSNESASLSDLRFAYYYWSSRKNFSIGDFEPFFELSDEEDAVKSIRLHPDFYAIVPFAFYGWILKTRLHLEKKKQPCKN
jgi:hypothetical protein